MEKKKKLTESDKVQQVYSRRHILQWGAASLALPGAVAHAAARPQRRGGPAELGRARACVVLFSWGGMSHIDTWDPKPTAAAEYRGEFGALATSVPGIQFSQYMPRLACQADHIAVVRSVHHYESDHRGAALQVLTGHAPPRCTTLLSRGDNNTWPGIGSTVAHMADQRRYTDIHRTVTLPQPAAHRDLLKAQYAGFLGRQHDPIFLCPPTPAELQPVRPHRPITLPDEGYMRSACTRMSRRRRLLTSLESAGPFVAVADQIERDENQRLAEVQGPCGPELRRALDLDEEPHSLRSGYGDHRCGRSVLAARRLVEAGVPLVTVYCGAGDLDNSRAAHWDTHVDNFNRLRRDMLPPLDQASAALLEDLRLRGMLEETLVVWLTEFGRTPRINSRVGRDHHSRCFSVAFAGGGIAGGRVFGRTDRNGRGVIDRPCVPADLHATIFHSLGIDPTSSMSGPDGEPVNLTEGRVLPLFA